MCYKYTSRPKRESMSNEELLAYVKKLIKKKESLKKKVKKLKSKVEIVESKYLMRKSYCDSCDKCNPK